MAGGIDLEMKGINIWSGSEFTVFSEYKYCMSADVYWIIKVVLFFCYPINTTGTSEYIFNINPIYFIRKIWFTR